MSWLIKSNSPYIKEDQYQLIRTHKYQGQELSYSYNYFYSPICTKLPNLVSLIGFLFNLGPHIMIPLFFTNDLEGDLPSWFCYFLGISFFIYMVCDNTDGKQARRTGSSSALGMLIDHGMDSITAFVCILIIQTLVQVGNNYSAIISLTASTLPFYFATIEQYYTGELILQVVNGIDDGSFLYIFICFAGGYYGPKELFLSQINIFGYEITYSYLLILTLSGSSYFQVIPKNTPHFKKTFRWPTFILHNLWMIIHIIVFFAAAYFSPENISETHTKRVQYAFGFQFILICLRIQYSIVTKEVFNPYRRTTILTWGLLIANTICAIVTGKSIMNEALMYLGLATISFLALIHLVICVIIELKAILGVNLLTLTQKQLDAQKTSTKRD
ncbi:cdp-alcohol phosphatidyltransferase family protein [Stylonychia lemnae]|uniref:Cdp-alcohol phosphatidyltransferase family protein n=1 Tax=Stylonychia lemnae TaxID=5949 RepID=A0A078B069_STYLE|nr:cdp-alcohol phosphatidyltransferase family protein [Stylonychia lemnae]|eukprot:CDW86468.1 cdp-alcohol phosphatidyltransferase family protein [Stylonychia lemnae]